MHTNTRKPSKGCSNNNNNNNDAKIHYATTRHGNPRFVALQTGDRRQCRRWEVAVATVGEESSLAVCLRAIPSFFLACALPWLPFLSKRPLPEGAESPLFEPRLGKEKKKRKSQAMCALRRCGAGLVTSTVFFFSVFFFFSRVRDCVRLGSGVAAVFGWEKDRQRIHTRSGRTGVLSCKQSSCHPLAGATKCSWFPFSFFFSLFPLLPFA